MNEEEAQQLVHAIQTDASRTRAKVYRIGNGEYVVIVRRMWLWSLADLAVIGMQYAAAPPTM